MDLVYSIVLFPRIEPVGEPYSEVCFNPELWFWMVSQPNSWSKRLGKWIEHFLAYCHNGKKYVGCIELVFKLIMQLADIKEKKKTKEKKKLGCRWDLIPGPLELQSNALPTELRGLWLLVNSWKLYLYLGWHGVTWHVKLTNEKCCMPKIEHIKLWCGSV